MRVSAPARRRARSSTVSETPALVTGATGMVGRAIVRALLRRQQRVRVFVRDGGRARALFGAAVEIAVGDLGDPESVGRAADGVGDVYHVAGVVDARTCNPDVMWDTNVGGTRRLLDACAGRFVYTSSVSVYGDRLPLNVSEDAPFHPAGVYGASKIEAERMVRDAAAGGRAAMVVRPCVVYGPGDRYFGPQASDVIRLPVVPLPDGGRHLVDLVHADDLADAQVLVMAKGRPGDVYNVTDGATHSLRDLIGWMVEASGRHPWRPSIPRWLAFGAQPVLRAAGRLLRIYPLAQLRHDDVDVFFSDYNFAIEKIRALGYAPRVDAHAAVPVALRAGASTA